MPRRDPADLACCTFANLRKASRALSQIYDAALQPVGLKATQLTLLATLERRGVVPVSQLAETLVMDRTTLTRNLKPLAARGLVAVEPGEDRRVRQVILTAPGRALLEAARPLWARAQRGVVERLGRGRWSGLLDDLAATVDLMPRS